MTITRDSPEVKLLAITYTLLAYLPQERAEERARNIVQALMDEPYQEDPGTFRREVAYEALVAWKLAPAGWESKSQIAAAAVVDTLEGRR